MNIVNFKSKDLEKLVRMKLNKNYGEEIIEEEISKIDSITFFKKDFLGKDTDIELDELNKFHNISEVIAKGFTLNSEDIKMMKKNKKIKNMHFNECAFEDDLTLDLNLEYLEINNCSGIDKKLFTKLKLLKGFVVRNQKNFDVGYISNLSKLKMLYIEDCENSNLGDTAKLSNLGAIYLKGESLDNANFLYRLKKIKYINLDGSNFKEDINRNMFSKNVEISKLEDNYPLERN